MASSTTPHYYLNPSKAHSSSHAQPSNQLHKNSRKLHATSTACISSSTSSSSASSSATSLFQNVVIPRERPHLGPEFRRYRTTKVISKRNTSTCKLVNENKRKISPAARQFLDLLLQSSTDDTGALSGIMGVAQNSLQLPDDFCSILHDLGDFHECPGKAVAFFHLSLASMRTPIEKGKLLTAAISALGKMGKHDLAKRLFDSGVAEGYGNTVFAYSAQISAYARNGLSTEAIALFKSMKARGVRPNNVSYNAVIDACGKGGVDPIVGLELFREMIHDRLTPDRKTFNSLIAGCSRGGYLEDARFLFDEMVLSGIGHDIYTYNTFVDTICKSGNMEMAMQIVQDMRACRVLPNVVTYSTLMDGYSKLDRYDDALKLYEEMKFLGIELDRVCYNTLLSIYVKTNKYENIVRVCEEMDLLGIENDAVTYNSLIHGYGKLGRLDVVDYMYQDMKKKQVLPTVLTYSTLIDLYSKSGMHKEAADVFSEFKKSGLKADVVLYSSLIDMLSKNGMVECAMWLLVEMKRVGVKPNVVSYNAVIDAYGKTRKFVPEGIGQVKGEQDDTCGQIVVKGFDAVPLTVAERSLAAQSIGRSTELLCILELFCMMNQQGVRPNVVTFSAILNACSRCNSFEDASVLLGQLRLFDNSIYGVAHGLLMGSRDVWRQAQSLFDELRHMDRQTSSAFYNALTDMLWYYGQRSGAQKVVFEAVKRQAWENPWSEFSLDLHLMSSGAAQAIVHAWLLNIHSVVFAGRKLPEFVSILTGWGKHSKAAGGTLCRVIEALLMAIGAPFHVERFNIGRFVSPGAVVAAWLRQSGTVNALLLYDKRRSGPPPPSDSQCDLLPGLQALNF